jgi:hypothetical protein
MWGNKGQQPRAIYVSSGTKTTTPANSKQARGGKKKEYTYRGNLVLPPFLTVSAPPASVTPKNEEQKCEQDVEGAPPAPTVTLYTAGYGGHGTALKFAEALSSAGVQSLMDIRFVRVPRREGGLARTQTWSQNGEAGRIRGRVIFVASNS